MSDAENPAPPSAETPSAETPSPGPAAATPPPEAADQALMDLSVEERLRLLEMTLVTRELAATLASTVQALGRQAPEALVLQHFYASRKHMMVMKGLVFLVQQRVARDANAQGYANALMGLLTAIDKSLGDINRHIRIAEAALAPEPGAAKTSAVSEAPVAPDAPRPGGGLVGPDGRPLG